MLISDILKKEAILVDLKSTNKEEIITEIAEHLCALNNINSKDANKVIASLFDREALGTTGIGDNVAIPHAKVACVDNIVAAFGKKKTGVDFDSIDGRPVNFIFLILVPESSGSLYIKVLARISKLLKNRGLLENLLKVEERDRLYSLIIKEDSLIV